MTLYNTLRSTVSAIRLFFGIVYRPITGPVPGEAPWPWRRRWKMRITLKQAWAVVKFGWASWKIKYAFERMQRVTDSARRWTEFYAKSQALANKLTGKGREDE